MGYSGKFLEAFITDPTTFPNPTIVGADAIDEVETPRVAWSHALHDRPQGAGFWVQDPLALDALYRPVPSQWSHGAVKSPGPIYARDLGIEGPSGDLVTGHIIATDPKGQQVLPKSASGAADVAGLNKGDVVMYRVIRGSADFRDGAGKAFEWTPGDTGTAGRSSVKIVGMADDTQILRLGLLAGMTKLRSWTSTQRDEIDGMGGKLIKQKHVRPLRTQGSPVGFLYT